MKFSEAVALHNNVDWTKVGVRLQTGFAKNGQSKQNYEPPGTILPK
jgi:hypothetical protein